MRLDSDSSERLNLIRFPLIVGVVFVHAYESVVGFHGVEAVLRPTSFGGNFIRDFVSMGLASISVPLFFLISGFLFFYQLEWSNAAYLRKVRARLKTLLVPLLLWNSLYILLIAVAQKMPVTATYFSADNVPVASFGAFDYVNTIIGIYRHPIACQFWYIRDLIVLIGLTPILRLTHKRIPLVFLVLLFCAWFFGIWPTGNLSIIPSPGPVLFFYAGSVMAIKRQTPFLLDKYGKAILSIYLILLISDTLSKGQPFDLYLHQAGIVIGIFAALYSTRIILVNKGVKALFLWLASASFFVFAFQEPLLTVIQRIIIKLLHPSTDISILFFYFSIPLVVILIALYAYKFLCSKFPAVAIVVTGGRSK